MFHFAQEIPQSGYYLPFNNCSQRKDETRHLREIFALPVHCLAHVCKVKGCVCVDLQVSASRMRGHYHVLEGLGHPPLDVCSLQLQHDQKGQQHCQARHPRRAKDGYQQQLPASELGRRCARGHGRRRRVSLGGERGQDHLWGMLLRNGNGMAALALPPNCCVTWDYPFIFWSSVE